MTFKSTIAAGLAALVALLAMPALAQQKADQTPICANCHEKAHTTTMLTAHGAKQDQAGSMCQACHGDASAHVQDPMKNKMPNPFKRASATERDAICMTCHSGQRHLAFWEAGKHAKNEVSCNNCHTIHSGSINPVPAPFTTTARANEADMCGTCHKPIRNAINKPSHHPIVEGKVKCSDCHNPHGALTHAMVKQETVNQQCESCHADKRGPFVFPHPPVEDNCLSCHNPHGSSHARLLNENVPNICQDCHDWSRHPGTFYGGQHGWLIREGMTGTPGAPNPAVSTRLIARACLNCHNAIHGTNAPANRGKFLIR
jgi:DmsE family decaheme c-type cytochrome